MEGFSAFFQTLLYQVFYSPLSFPCFIFLSAFDSLCLGKFSCSEEMQFLHYFKNKAATMEDIIKLLNVEAQKQVNHKENKIYSVKIMV